MSAKIKSMELVHADILYPDQLMPNDIIKIENDLLTIVSVEDTETGYKITTLNEFGEEDSIETNNETSSTLIHKVGDLIEKYFDLNSVPRISFFETFELLATDELEKEKLVEFLSPEGSEDLNNYCYR